MEHPYLVIQLPQPDLEEDSILRKAARGVTVGVRFRQQISLFR